MAEAAHSALDLVAAAVTFFAVRISGRPADEKQMFGYGKVENLSALFETLLLLLTCVWIIYEAIQRLFYKQVEVEVSIWSFIVMLTSIIVDVSRSRALMKAAKKHGSQALEADALHFSTDVWSSSVVIGGLILVTLGKFLESRALLSESVLVWFHRADAIAALGVSIIVIYVSVELGKRTIDGLLDKAPQGMRPQIVDKVSQIPGLLKVRQVRIRPSGPSTFVDMILEVPRNASLEEAHAISMKAKEVVKNLISRVDVIIHLDPMVIDENSIVESVRSIASRARVTVHSIRAHGKDPNLLLETHIEVPEELTVEEAHNRVTEFESMVNSEIPQVKEVVTHIEPLGEKEIHALDDPMESRRIQEIINKTANNFKEITNCHSLIVYRAGSDLSISFHCDVLPSLNISEAHKLTGRMERQVRLEMPELERVTIHVEPQGAADRDAQ